MELKIYTDSIKNDSKFSFKEIISTHNLLPKESDLIFADTLKLSGDAYLAGDHVMIDLNAQLAVQMPCSICNEPVSLTLKLSHFTHAEPLEEISGGVFDFTSLLISSLLLELPQFIECNGQCPERENLKKYLKNPETSSSTKSVQFPFSGL